MASHLYNLPPELLLATFQYMPRPSDLHALCLTSKPIRDWAIMLLYNKVTLDSDDGPWLHTAEKSLLRIGHPGLAHVRRLTIFTGKSDEDCDKEARFLRLFLSVLPRNGLRHLNCASLKLDETTMFMIVAQQQKLQTISLGPVMCDFAALVEHSALSLTSLTAISVPHTIGATEIQAYQGLIKGAPHLSDLRIGCVSNLDSSEEVEDLEIDSAGLQRELLGFADSEGEVKLKIVRLRLMQILVGDHFTSRFDLSYLRSLSLWHCDDVAFFLPALTVATTSGECALQSFSYDGGWDEFFEYDLVENLLRSFSGLKKLSLSCDGKEDPNLAFDLTALDSHKDTLQSLFLGCNNIDELGDEQLLAFDSAFFTTFSKLRYLAVPMPAIVIPINKADLPSSEYITAFKSLTSLPDLKVLRILNWPRVAPGTFALNSSEDENAADMNPLNAKSYSADLDTFVNKTLGPHLQKINVLWYGESGGHDNRTSDGTTEVFLNSAYYVAEKRTDLYGTTRTSASRTSLREASFIEPEIESDVAWSGMSM